MQNLTNNHPLFCDMLTYFSIDSLYKILLSGIDLKYYYSISCRLYTFIYTYYDNVVLKKINTNNKDDMIIVLNKFLELCNIDTHLKIFFYDSYLF